MFTSNQIKLEMSNAKINKEYARKEINNTRKESEELELKRIFNSIKIAALSNAFYITFDYINDNIRETLLKLSYKVKYNTVSWRKWINMNNKYTVNYFIEKFNQIPEEEWCVGTITNYQNQKCAVGHCDSYTKACQLTKLFLQELNTKPTIVNDGRHNTYTQKTPKQRILAALIDIKNKIK